VKTRQFFGHKATLQRLDDGFQEVFSESFHGPCVAVLVGMVGIGKTQIALEYCKQAYSRETNRFHDIFWFNASSEDTLTRDFAKTAALLAAPGQQFESNADRVEFVRSHFEALQRSFLLVLDNFDDPMFDTVLEYLPSVGPCAVLLTSRLREADSLGFLVEVPLMNDEDATDLLLGRLRLTDLPESQSDEIQQVCHMLGNLPLALEQAGAYMTSGGAAMSFRTFIGLYNKKKEEVMKTTPKFWKYQNIHGDSTKSGALSIFTTWTLSLERLGSDQAAERKSHFLTLLSFLDNERISRRLFESYYRFRKTSPIYRLEDDWMLIFQSSDGSFDQMRYNEAVMELSNLSLIREIRKDEPGESLSLSLHPLIRDWAQFRIPGSRRHLMAIEASFVMGSFLEDYKSTVGIPLIQKMIPERETLDVWTLTAVLGETISEILAHIDCCILQWERFHVPSTALISKDRTYSIQKNFGATLHSLSKFAAAYKMYSQLLRLVETDPEFEAASGLRRGLKMTLCSLRVSQGRGSEVVADLEALLVSNRDLLGDNHVDSILCSFCLAEHYAKEKDHKKAKKLALSIYVPILSWENPEETFDDATIGTRLAILFQRLGLFEEAYKIQDRMLTRLAAEDLKTEKDLLTDMVGVLETTQMTTLLSEYMSRGGRERLDEVEHRFRQLVSKADPKSDIAIAITRANIAVARGQWGEALEASEYLYRTYCKVLGAWYPASVSWLVAYFNARLRTRRQEVDESVSFVRERICEAEKKLGPLHEVVVSAQLSTAIALSNNDHPREARLFYEAVLTKRIKMLETHHPLILEAQTSLARSLIAIPNRSPEEKLKATSVLQDVVFELQLRSEDSLTASTFSDILWARTCLGSLVGKNVPTEELVGLYEDTLRTQVALHGKDSPEAWKIQLSMGAFYFRRSELSLAAEIYETVASSQAVQLGETHEDSMTTLGRLCHTYSQTDFELLKDKYDKVEGCYHQLLEWRLERYGAGNKEEVEVRRWLGRLLKDNGNYKDALDNLRDAYNFSRRSKDAHYFSDLLYLSNGLYALKSHKENRTILHERLDWVKQKYESESRETLWSLAALATNSEDLKKYAEAITYRKQELLLREKLDGPSHIRTSMCLYTIAELYSMLGNLEDTKRFVSRALIIAAGPDKRDNKHTLPLLLLLGEAEYRLKNPEDSLLLADRGLRYCQENRTVPKGVESKLKALKGMALENLRKFEQSEELLIESLDGIKETFGENHDSTMKSQYRLARCKFLGGKFAEAAPLLECSLLGLREVEQPSTYWERYWTAEIDEGENMLEICRRSMRY